MTRDELATTTATNVTATIDARNYNDLSKAVLNADLILNKSYLSLLGDSQIEPTKTTVAENANFLNELNASVRFFDVTQIVLNKNENMRDKLVSVFNAVGTTGASLLTMIQGEADSVSVSFGVKTSDTENISKYSQILENSLKGNFPGTKLNDVRKNDIDKKIKEFPINPSVASVTDVPGMRSEEENKDRQFMQGIEKFVDAMRGLKYTMLLIADPISLLDMQKSRRALENLYSSLVPFSESQYTMGANESDGISKTISEGTTDSVNNSVSDTVSHTIGKSSSTTEGTSKGGGVSLTPFGIGGSSNFSKNHSITEGVNVSDTNSQTQTNGSSYSVSKTTADGTTYTAGTNRSLQIKFENHSIKQLMSKIDETLKRYDTCADLGMWNCGVYFIAETEYISQMAASVYHSIIRGKNSSLENGAVILWNADKSKLIANQLKYMEHPFVNINDMKITPGTLVSSAELAIQAGLPNHSLPGLPVLECAEFGRTVSTFGKTNAGENYNIKLGKIFHMHQQENLSVDLNPDSLASHTFITGSTGSGKSNTVYKILGEVMRIGQKFLVVEPAKGEYKNVFGTKSGVHVYGTNPELSPMLRLNPFSFPHGNEDASKNIHILEHLDRLIEIFNVCWPMYAAMPAVLKEAVEKSYEDAGWILAESANPYGEDLYPTFADVARNVRTIIDSSEYDAENKGAYKGALVTRLKSLTNGINGLIFTTDEIAGKDLFDENVIVDLSRVGSSETKSLLMGLLVLKLQEYRMTSGQMNEPLKHITVLEEAHNLLKRTSTEQTSESGNLRGKSVEMLTNAIAEMRTYGEGFIIADQAPALLDMAVIRNTNTKIIMRLPDQSDRELVGRAANLNEDQITELAKFPCGVAAVYQNEWVESVLCKVEKFEDVERRYCYKKPEAQLQKIKYEPRLEIAKLLCTGTAVTGDAETKDLAEKLHQIKLRATTEVAIIKYLAAPPSEPRMTKLAPLMAELFPQARVAIVQSYNVQVSDTKQWSRDVDKALLAEVQCQIDDAIRRGIRQCIITDYLRNELGKLDKLKEWSEKGAKLA